MVATAGWFDNLTRGVAAPSSRRLILGGLFGGLLMPGGRPAQAAPPSNAHCTGGSTGCCTFISTDPENCGACGHACATGQICITGLCACPGTTTLCSGACVNLRNDPHNCGACAHACATGQICFSGACQVSCASPEVLCGGECVDLSSNNANCGFCGT